jgi:signal transduction histidine kinase
MDFAFNPADIQAVGVGFAAFLASLLSIFIFLSARREKLGRPMWHILAASSAWAWFGFFYHIIPDLWLAREMRVLSVIGIVMMTILEFPFALAYLSERVEPGAMLRRAIWAVYAIGAVLIGLLASDLFGTNFVVGELTASPSVVLAPQAGPWMAVLVAYYALCISSAGALIAWRARVAEDDADRRRALILFSSMTIGFALGGTRFTPWFGFDFYPLVGDMGFPLFAFAALYVVSRYRLLNLQVAAAQVLVFVLWAFTFFRLLLDKSLQAALPDIGLFAAVLVLGIFLLRAVVGEVRTQHELAKLTLEKAKSEFVTIAAHQLRTPLSAVRWSLGLLRSSTTLGADDRDIVEKGAEAADNMMYIVGDLLNVARMEGGKMQFDMTQSDLREVARTAVDVLSEAAKAKNVSVALEIPQDPVLATFDHDKMVMVAENLLDNAIKYTPKGGAVTIAVSGEPGGCRIRVTDSGIGIIKEESAHLFERFYRSDRAKRMFTDGSGLGLYIVRTILDGHHGKVALEPGASGGAVATVDFPRAGAK